ncbi:MAG: type II toxin-antitoxin system RelE/ParE family toxin [Dehalococcoidia bacterium]
MEIQFANSDLDRLETDPAFAMGLAVPIVRAYRKRLQFIRSALDERDFYTMKSWRFEKRKGKRQDQYSMRLNQQFRLIPELLGSGRDKLVRILGIEDYH